MLSAFVELLNEGVFYTQISPEMITERAGVTRPAFYFYFKGKSDALIEVIGNIRKELYDSALAFLTSKEISRELLIKTVRANVRIRAHHHHLLRAALEACVTNRDFCSFYVASMKAMIDGLGERIVQIRDAQGRHVSKQMAASIARALVSATDFNFNILTYKTEKDWEEAVGGMCTIWVSTIFGSD